MIKHRNSGKHIYESQNLIDNAVSTVAGAGGIMAAGTHRNRLADYDDIAVRKGEGFGKSEGSNWFRLGCSHLRNGTGLGPRGYPHGVAAAFAMEDVDITEPHSASNNITRAERPVTLLLRSDRRQCSV